MSAVRTTLVSKFIDRCRLTPDKVREVQRGEMKRIAPIMQGKIAEWPWMSFTWPRIPVLGRIRICCPNELRYALCFISESRSNFERGKCTCFTIVHLSRVTCAADWQGRKLFLSTEVRIWIERRKITLAIFWAWYRPSGKIQCKFWFIPDVHKGKMQNYLNRKVSKTRISWGFR